MQSSKKGHALRGVLGPLIHTRDRIKRAYSIVADSEVTPGSLEIWSDLPEEIKNDPSLAPFKNRYEKQFGSKIVNSTVIDEFKNHNITFDSHSRAMSPPHATANGISPPHKTPENNNIGTSAYFTKSIPCSETSKVCPVLVRQNSDTVHHTLKNEVSNFTRPRLSLGNEKSMPTRRITPAQMYEHVSKPKVSFLSSNVLESSIAMNTSSKPQSITTQNDVSAHDDTDAVTGHKKPKPWMRNIKILLLLVCWMVFTGILLMKNENSDEFKPMSVPVNKTKAYFLFEQPLPTKLSVKLNGPFVPEGYGNLSDSWLYVWVEAVQYTNEMKDLRNKTTLENSEVKFVKNISLIWKIALISEEMIDFVPYVQQSKVFNLDLFDDESKENTLIKVIMSSNVRVNTPLTISCNTKPIEVESGIIYAAIVLVLLYILIIFEIVHRTFAAMLASTLSVAILAILDQRPTTAVLISWIDIETLLLLFSMMVIVAILSETGIFDYLAVYAYKVTAGRVWPLINCLCLFTAIMSSFLDNVTTVLLMTPVTIRLCEVMELNPVPILMSMIIFSNIGGTLTPVGDPPNVIIASNAQIQSAGIDFALFTLHMSFGIVLVVIQTYIHLRFYFRDINSLRHSEPQDVRELRREILVWQHAAASLSSYSKDEDIVRVTLNKKVNRMMTQLKKKLTSGRVAKETYTATLQDLTDKYPIRNKVLLVKCAIAVTFVILFFFLHSIPALQRLSLGWTALLGALLLLILADRNDMEAVLARVEWSTLLFFAALFILMEALSKLGLINWIGKQTEAIIMSVDQESRLAVAILLILWVSAVASAFVDNIPLTTMMIRIATDLGENPALNLPLQPLVWALAFGACLGGNGTLIGASANVVCAGVAEQHGYRFSFMEYFKVGFPVMLGSISVITVYMLVCHVLIEWH